MTRVFSGIQPSGDLHLGNLLGALVNWSKMQDDYDAVYCIVDLHALTLPQEPGVLQKATIEQAQLLMAIGIDPERSILFVQSHVPQHTELAWLMECTVSYGELSRMTAVTAVIRSERIDAGGSQDGSAPGEKPFTSLDGQFHPVVLHHPFPAVTKSDDLMPISICLAYDPAYHGVEAGSIASSGKYCNSHCDEST